MLRPPVFVLENLTRPSDLTETVPIKKIEQKFGSIPGDFDNPRNHFGAKNKSAQEPQRPQTLKKVDNNLFK
jgi:hypothetical protein